jgi:hypothetical protein
MRFDDIELTHVGGFTVDSGQVMIGDPCYLDEWQNWNRDKEPFDNHVNKAGEYGYLGACAITLKDNFGVVGDGRGVVSTTGYGDGYYSVFAEMNEDGRVAKLIIDFEGSIEADLTKERV